MSRMTASEEWNSPGEDRADEEGEERLLPHRRQHLMEQRRLLKGAEACLMRVSESSMSPSPMRMRPMLCGRSSADQEWTT